MRLRASVEYCMVKGRGAGHSTVSDGVVLVSRGVVKGPVEVGGHVQVDAPEAAGEREERLVLVGRG